MTLEECFPLSHSALSAFDQSPLHYLHYKARLKAETPAMIFGKAYHCFMLEPEKFPEKYIVQPKFDLRTTIGKAGNAAFQEANKDKVFISETDLINLKGMQEAMYSCKPAKVLIDEVGETEKEIIWTDEVTMVRLRGIIDGDGGITLDLKTCKDATPRLFNATIFNYGYHRQGAMYSDGLVAQKKRNKRKPFFFIAQEKEAPFGVSIHRMTDEALEAGRIAYQNLILDFLRWTRTLAPVGYEYRSETGHYDVTIPKWMRYGDN